MKLLIEALVGLGLALGVATIAVAQEQAEQPSVTEEEAAEPAPADDSATDAPAAASEEPADDTPAATEEPADGSSPEESDGAEPTGDQPEAAEPAATPEDDAAATDEAEDTVTTAPLGGTVPVDDEQGEDAGEDHGSGEEGEGHTQHYPIRHPMHVDWTFGGPFGTYDIGQLQRGFKVYKEVCSACHSMKRVAFRDLEALGYSEGQIKTIAADYEVEDGPNADGEMFTRTAVASDRFPSPYPNEEAAAASNNGAAPPDFSLLAKARAVERGFPTFVFDIFTGYAESGPDYIYSLLHGYDEEKPEHIELPAGVYYNPYFIASAGLAMAKPISDGQVSYDDGSPETLDQYSQDVAAFMMWAAEPKLEERKRIGLRVILFLLLFGGLMWLTKRKVWRSVKH